MQPIPFSCIRWSERCGKASPTRKFKYSNRHSSLPPTNSAYMAVPLLNICAIGVLLIPVCWSITCRQNHRCCSSPHHIMHNFGFQWNQLQPLVSHNSAASLLCAVLTFSILNEAGLFPRKRDLPPEEKPVLFSPAPTSERLLQALSPDEKIHLRNKKDWENAVKLYRTRKNTSSPDILWICCEQRFSHSLTLIDLLPFYAGVRC